MIRPSPLRLLVSVAIRAFASPALIFAITLPALAAPRPVLLTQACTPCHNTKSPSGGLDLTGLPFELKDRASRERWTRIHDRIEKREMPPPGATLPDPQRAALLKELSAAIRAADAAEVAAQGRGPMRRLNRDEFEQNLRDLLQLPYLDLREMLPEDRLSHHFHKTAETLDTSRVQLTAYLDATEFALREALAKQAQPPAVTTFRAIGTRLFPGSRSTGNRESMFFVKDNRGLNVEKENPRPMPKEWEQDPAIEMAIFRSPGWPYAAHPRGFTAPYSGEYRVRFSARAVLQQEGYLIEPAQQPVPMMLRARKPSNHDIAEPVRATGGMFDVQPQPGVYTTTVRLDQGQNIEYGLLGLPAPQIDAIRGMPGTYRFPPFPPGGQPGVAFQWVEIEGPILPSAWPPPSHRVVLDELGIAPAPKNAPAEASRLLRRFILAAARGPVPEEATAKFDRLVHSRLAKGEPFLDALLAGYQAFLCSDLFLYLPEPRGPQQQFAIASRLSHLFTNSRPDAELLDAARQQRLSDSATVRQHALRLMASEGFERFVNTFTDDWLNLRFLRRDDPDHRLYPEYRLDEYLTESMERETRLFFTALFRENLPVRTLIEADFIFANERLAKHYQLPPLTGTALRKVTLPAGSPLGGLLTQAAIMKVTANGTSTSPVIRGAWIMDRLLGEPPPPPPPGVPAVEPDIRGAKTIRDLLALHTKSSTCAACHAKFDPVGLALESFDVMGGWRDRYRGLEQGEKVSGIDRAGHDYDYTVANPVDPSGKLADGRTFKDIRELKALFAAQPRQLARNLLRQWVVYSTGTPVRFADRVELESMLDACAPGGYRVRDLMLELVSSKLFLGPAGGR